jgi:hypothetical protein
MKRNTRFIMLFAATSAAPLLFSSPLTSTAQAQDRAEFQDVPRNHWAYAALQALTRGGVFEGYGTSDEFRGQRGMTRYEFAVAIARYLYVVNPIITAPHPHDLSPLESRLEALESRQVPDMTRAQATDLIEALKREFRPELERLGARVDTLESRVTWLENSASVPPRLSITTAISHQTGYANYIDNSRAGRTFLNPLLLRPNPFGINALFAATILPGELPLPGGGTIDLNLPLAAFDPTPRGGGNGSDKGNKKFSMTDFGIHLRDRVSDSLNINAELRSLGSNQEDPWAGDSEGGFYLRQAYASADLSNKRLPGVKGLNATIGRQHTKIGQGLLYDNELSPTDQARADFNVGPLSLTGFVGSTSNVAGLGQVELDPYVTQGAVFYLNTGIVANDRAVGFPGFGVGVIDTGVDAGLGNLDLDTDFDENSYANQRRDDNEGLVRASARLFRLGDQPVQLAYSRLLDGFRHQEAESIDLDVPIFRRNIGIEYVRNLRTAYGNKISEGRSAFIATVPVLQSRTLDLSLSYGQADDDFVYNVISSANPFARSYGEAIFDRPIALGSPLMSDLNGGSFLAAKRTFDVKGTLRLPFLRRLPLNFRYYNAKSGANLRAAAVIGFQNGGRRIDLGDVYSIGTTLNITPGLDLSVMGGVYNPAGDIGKLRYVRVGASYGF